MKRIILSSLLLTAFLAAPRLEAALIYWDGPSGGWDTAANWSTSETATTPDPLQPPGLLDVAVFNITGQNAATTVSLNGDQSALGLSVLATGGVTLQGGGTNQTLMLGANGITVGTGVVSFNLGSATAGQNVNVSLLGSQTWAYNGANNSGNGMFVRNGVSNGTALPVTLTLGGTTGSTAVSGILGPISDGSGTLNLTMDGGTTNRWNLNVNNSYTGVTTISGGALGISTATGLGATSNGTTVESGAALFLRNTGVVSFAAEPLSIAGTGPAASARGALRQVGGGTSTWNGPISANATAGTVRIGADAGSLTIANDISTTGSNALDFETTGAITVSGNISGNVSLTKTLGGGTAGTNLLTLAGANNTYTGATTVSAGILVLTGNLVNTSGVTVDSGAALRGTGSINNASTATINGTIGAGVNPSTIGTLSLGNLAINAGGTFSLDIDTTALTNDRVNAAGNLSLDIGNASNLSIGELNANVTPLAPGTAFTFIDYGGTWNGGLFSVSGTPIADDTGVFTFGANDYTIDYNGGPMGNDVRLLVVPEPSTFVSLLGGIGLLVGLRRSRRR